MKELEKIERISIASILFILVILIGLLTYKRPKNTYTYNTKNTLEKLSDKNYFVNINDINNQNYVLVDIRSGYEFDKDHLKNAINIHTPDLLNEDNLNVFKKLKTTNKTAILYGNDPHDVNMPFILLYQLGYDNIKILAAKNNYLQNKLISKNCEIEKTENDIKFFIDESVKKSEIKVKAKVQTAKRVPAPKKVITVQKKKKKMPEGGC